MSAALTGKLAALQTEAESEPQRIRWHSVDQRRDGRGRFNRSFWISNLPRVIVRCRLLGHKPIVDGVDFGPSDGPKRRSRWACCDRCGVRLLQPVDSDLQLDQPYTDALPPAPRALGEISGQLVLLGGYDGFGAEIKIGNMGSENRVAGHLHLGRLAGFYWGTGSFGTWLQRRLNPKDYESRVTGVSAHNGRVYGQVWAKQNSSSCDDPWWMSWSFPYDLRTILLGPKRYRYDNVGQPIEVTVRMADGDDHQVTLQLQRESLGRDRSKRRELSWSVDWRARPGIPTKPGGRGRVGGCGVKVSDHAADTGTWPQQAAANIAADLARDRVRYGYRAAVGK